MSSLNKPLDQPFAAEGGMAHRPPTADDPFKALEDLMVVVEALWPTWPTRETFQDSGKMLL